MSAVLHWLEQLPEPALYAVQFLALFLEGTGLPGIFVEPFFLATGVLVGRGRMPFLGAWLAAAAGNFAGNLAGYALGRASLEPLLRRVGPRLGLTPERLEEARGWFQRYGAWTVFIGRWFGPIRTPAILFAGDARVPLPRYALASAAAALSWTAVYQLAFTWLGRTAVDLWQRRAGWLAAALLGAAALAWAAWQLRRRRRRRGRRGAGGAGGGGARAAAGGAGGAAAGGVTGGAGGAAARLRRWRRPARKTLAALVVGGVSLAAPASFLLFHAEAGGRAPVPPDQLPVPNAATRLLVIAPHPDDETLGAGGLIQRTLAAGGQVHVVVVTAGDSFSRATILWTGHLKPGPADYRALGVERLHESQRATAILGLRPDQLTELGFPDKGLERLWYDYWGAPEPYLSPFSRASSVPYRLADRGLPYDADSLAAALRSVIETFDPTVVIAPYPLDGHPDHRAAYDFTMYALAAAQRSSTSVYTYLVHHGDWPAGWGVEPFTPLVPPRDLRHVGHWVHVALSRGEIERKLDAIEAYISQMRVMGGWLRTFARSDELFQPAPQAVLAPHEAVPAMRSRDELARDVASGGEALPVLPPPLKTRLDPGSALRAVRVERVGPELVAAVETLAPPNPLTDYRLRFWAFSHGAARGYVITLDRGAADVRPLAAGGPAWPAGQAVRVTLRTDGFLVEIPWEALTGTTDLLMECESGVGRIVLDRTGWALFRVTR
ncbi:MAG: PIG-L family deacetylase [Firmicutes bacterium]|nr:PIG-L family deacetylase [Bacillota bacterium]